MRDMRWVAVVAAISAALMFSTVHAQTACGTIIGPGYKFRECPDGSHASATIVGNEEYWKLFDRYGNVTYWRVWYVGQYSYMEQESDPGPYYIPDASPYYIPPGDSYAH
jgi:hypothetical protein